jgi:hypothetical protein
MTYPEAAQKGTNISIPALKRSDTIRLENYGFAGFFVAALEIDSLHEPPETLGGTYVP